MLSNGCDHTFPLQQPDRAALARLYADMKTGSVDRLKAGAPQRAPGPEKSYPFPRQPDRLLLRDIDNEIAGPLVKGNFFFRKCGFEDSRSAPGLRAPR